MKSLRGLDPIKKLKKENHFGITPVASAKRSHNLIEEYCIENDLIDEVEENPTAETAEVLKIKLEFECEEQRLASEEAQRAREAAKTEAQRACEAAEAEAQRARETAEAEAQKAYDAEKALQEAQLAQARDLRLAELREAHNLCE